MSANILESVRVNSIPNLVYITSDKCYLNYNKKNYNEDDVLGGIDNYSSSKASAEIILNLIMRVILRHHTYRLQVQEQKCYWGGDFKQ